jgi:hypothetical protein
MSKWFFPLAVLGVGSLGVLLTTDEGLELLHEGIRKLTKAPQTFLDWNDAAQRELDRLQAAVSELTESFQLAQ